MSLRIRRGTETQRIGVTFDQGELLYTTDSKKLYIGDGVTAGGYDPARPVNGVAKSGLAGVGLSYNDSTGNLDVSLSTFTTNSLTEGSNNKYFTNQRAQDAFGALLAAGTQTGITMTYDSVLHKLNVSTVDQVGITSVSADPSPTLGANLNLGGKNITGTGNIDITGTLGASAGLGRDLTLGGYNLTGTGLVNITGSVTANSITASAGNGLIQAFGVTSGTVSSSYIRLRTSRSGNTALLNNDVIGDITFDAYTGTADKKAVIIETSMASSITSQNFSSKLVIYTLNADGNYRPFSFDQNGGLSLTALGLSPLTTAQIAGGPTPANGNVVYNSDYKTLQVYNGTTFTLPLAIGQTTTPTSSTDTGVKGQCFVDNSWLYIATGTNTWRRVALSTF